MNAQRMQHHAAQPTRCWCALQVGNAAIARIDEELSSMQEAMSQRAADLDGTSQMMAIKEATRKLRAEMKRMDVRIGVLKQQLASKQRQNMVRGACLNASEEGDGGGGTG